MTKKDFELIARIILANKNYSLQTNEQKKAIDNLSFDFSHTLGLMYPKFNKEKFLQACGVDN